MFSTLKTRKSLNKTNELEIKLSIFMEPSHSKYYTNISLDLF